VPGHHRSHGARRHCQSLSDKGADYLFCLKVKWPVLSAEVERFFAEADAEASTAAKPPSADPAASNSAACRLPHIDWLTPTGGFPGEWRYDGLAWSPLVAMVRPEPTRRQNQHRAAPLSFIGQALRQTVRRRVRAIGTSKPPALDMVVVFHTFSCACEPKRPANMAASDT
jgi:hypothetical protein